jgi:Resolvase, N terminal domain
MVSAVGDDNRGSHMRAAIYARFSSDLQDLRSISDQVDLARRYAEGRSLNVVDVYDDAAISGASTLNRPGLLRLIGDAQARKFDVIITESLDRLSRSQANIAALYERLQFLGVRIATYAYGPPSGRRTRLQPTAAPKKSAATPTSKPFTRPTTPSAVSGAGSSVPSVSIGAGCRPIGSQPPLDDGVASGR